MVYWVYKGWNQEVQATGVNLRGRTRLTQIIYRDFCSQCRLVSNLLFSTEKKYYLNILHEHRRNTKQVFKVCDSLLGRGKEPSLPPGFTNQELADNFNDFFITKITNIRLDLSESKCRIIRYTDWTSLDSQCPWELSTSRLWWSSKNCLSLTNKDLWGRSYSNRAA